MQHVNTDEISPSQILENKQQDVPEVSLTITMRNDESDVVIKTFTIHHRENTCFLLLGLSDKDI